MQSQSSAAGKAEFTLEYEITRPEYSRGDHEQLQRADQKPRVVSASMSRLIVLISFERGRNWKHS